MNLLSKLLLAVTSSIINPSIGFIGSIIEYITSEEKNAGTVFLMDLASNILPGGFITNLSLGLITDAFRCDYLTEGVNKTIPFSNITLKCDSCNKYTNYYVQNRSLISCNDCFERGIENRVKEINGIYVFDKTIYELEQNVKVKNANISNNIIDNNIIDNRMI